MIAALFVEKDGVYYNLPDIDPWDKERDARLYRGSYPVIAHPPCQRWTNLTCLNYKRYGGEHNRPGNDGGCFESALYSLMQYGGVLEHPAYSRAWPVFDLPRPKKGGGWSYSKGVWVCEICQSQYGHRARKKTWLLLKNNKLPPELCWGDKAGTHQCGWFDRKKPTLSKKESTKTPIPFRNLLISLVRGSL